MHHISDNLATGLGFDFALKESCLKSPSLFHPVDRTDYFRKDISFDFLKM